MAGEFVFRFGFGKGRIGTQKKNDASKDAFHNYPKRLVSRYSAQRTVGGIANAVLSQPEAAAPGTGMARIVTEK